MSDHNLSLDAHTAHDMTILTVTMGRLVLVHEVHVNRIIRYLLIKLCVEMHQRLSVLLKSKNP